MADSTKLEPITLPQWPSCIDCLVSSEDDLAVASGENVHILTPRGKASAKDPGPYSHWHNSTIRVNQFSDDEWPFQTLSTVKHLSLGEEQSESLVTSLAWSHLGLGLHKRSVLAVLTSNLVLSLWETDGTLGQYHRTCIVNQHLPAEDHTEHEIGAYKHLFRIRAFAWTRPLKKDRISKYGVHHMILVNDAGEIMALRISKTVPSKYGTWLIQILHRAPLSNSHQTDKHLSTMAPLQRRLYESKITSRIIISDWQQSSTHLSETGDDKNTAKVELKSGQVNYTCQLSAALAQVTGDQVNTREWTISIHHDDDAVQEKPFAQHQLADQVLEFNDKITELGIQFKAAIKPLTKSFDHKNGLGGYYRVKFWGACQVLTTSLVAACITMHPTDMIEHTQPSIEKCFLVFVRTGKTFATENLKDFPEVEIRNKIVEFALSQAQNINHLWTSMDTSILRTLASVSQLMLGSDSNSSIFNTLLQKGTEDMILSNDTNNIQRETTSADNTGSQPQLNTPEECEICSSPIPFLSDGMSAKCSNGHEFTRCNLSFLAIQEPGISKYCSGCGRQFLDLIKFKTPNELSFSQALFDHFDVCPYCEAKFRG